MDMTDVEWKQMVQVATVRKHRDHSPSICGPHGGSEGVWESEFLLAYNPFQNVESLMRSLREFPDMRLCKEENFSIEV